MSVSPAMGVRRGPYGPMAQARRMVFLLSGLIASAALTMPADAAGVWRLQGAQDYRSPPYNKPGIGRFADADPFCRGHVVEIGGGRDSQSFLVRDLIPGDCHNRNGARGVAEVKHEWTAPPSTLVPGQPVPLRLRSTVSTLQNFGRVEGTLDAGFVTCGSRNEYGEPGGGSPERQLRVASSFVVGSVGATASDDSLRPAQRAEPLRVPEAPWLGSEHNQGQMCLRLFTWQLSGIWASVEYVYRWDASAPAATGGAMTSPGLSVGGQTTVTGQGVNLGQVWAESENGWTGTWTRRGSSNVFDAVWTKGGERVTAVLTITLNPAVTPPARGPQAASAGR